MDGQPGRIEDLLESAEAARLELLDPPLEMLVYVQTTSVYTCLGFVHRLVRPDAASMR